jgi:hypothetical protein
VALILVLGALSLMMILAVAFAISMRTERLAAGNYADTVRARELAHVGLVRAMNDIRTMQGANLAVAGAQVYPAWLATNAINGHTNALQYATLTNGVAPNYIPKALLSGVSADAANRWVEITAADGTLLGRVGYLILNCSGLLDANFVGGSNRLYGASPAEIAVTNLPEISGGGNNLINRRDPPDPAAIRYESVAELDVYSGDSHPSNFFIYSYYTNGWWNANGNNIQLPVNLAGDLTGAGRGAAILAGFTNAGFSASEAGILYTNLLNYVDSDFNPLDFINGVEAVPMINEVVVSNRVVIVPGATQSVGGVAIEWWYPFANTGGAFEIRTIGTFANISPGDASLIPTNIVDMTNTASGAGMGVMHIPFFSGPATGAFSALFRATIQARIVKGGANVDAVTVVLTNGNNTATTTYSSVEFVDPRFNGEVTINNASYTTNPSLGAARNGATNACTLNWWTANPGFDTDPSMYVANSNLHSAAELGCLAYAPWKTVKLYGPNLRRVLDTFAVGTNPADNYVSYTRRGLVNPNSKQTNALAAVLVEMPVDEYPGGPSNRLSLAAAQTMAGYLVNGGYYTNLSDIGRSWTTFVSASNELQRESYFRNSADLLSVRQNLFEIILEVQLAYSGIYPRYTNLAHQRAVAIVWRDPYTGEFLVRSFQWLED